VRCRQLIALALTLGVLGGVLSASGRARLGLVVYPPRADAVRDRLIALAERFTNPSVDVSPPAAALCRRLLCDAQHSPLYNPHVPEDDLGRILDVVEREISPDARRAALRLICGFFRLRLAPCCANAVVWLKDCGGGDHELPEGRPEGAALVAVEPFV
jgi:hypothetical protein